MVDKFGSVMIYVNNPKSVADFWVEKVKFELVSVNEHEGHIISAEVKPYSDSDTTMVLFDKVVVSQMSPEIHLGTPSILFSSKDLESMRNTLVENGVTVGDLVMMGELKTFNFADNEGNYFAVREI